MTALLDHLFSTLSPLWAMSLTAAYVAAVVVLLRLILKKRAPRRILCLLWLVVFARLLIPVTFESPISIVPDEARVQQIQDLPSGLVGGGAVPDPTPAQDPMPAGSAAPVTQEDPGPDTVPVLSTPDGVDPVTPQSPAPFPWQALAAGVWLAGALSMCLYGIVSYLRLKARLRDAIRAGDGAWEHPSVRSPFILGMACPRVYLPAGLTGTPRRFILCHEQAHLRRLDHIVKPVCWLALALHWFNPVVWLAYVLMSRDIEVACDEAVIRQLGPQVKADYSATLLSLATNGRVPAPCPLAFDEGNAKGRIKNVLRYRRPALWIVVVSVILVIAAAVCLLTDPVAADETPPGPDASTSQPPEKSDSPLESWMEEVLGGSRTFRSGEKEFNIHQLRTMVYGDGELPKLTLEVGKLAILDLDRDGINELVVWPTGEHDDPTEVGYSTGYFIFRREGDAVRVFYPGWRSVGELKADGTFDWSGSAFNWGTGTLRFSGASCTIDQITWCDNNAEDEHYFVDGVTATREQFDAAIDAHSAKDEPIWYIFADGQLKYAPIDVPIPLDEYAQNAPVPDFLDADQQLLYRQTYSMYCHVFGANTEEVDNWPGQHGYDYDPQTDLVRRGEDTYVPATGLYANWSDFRQAVLSVFTQNCWDSRNGSDSRDTYINVRGTLYYLPAARGSGDYNENFPETFRLVEQTDDAISFVMTGYYSEGHLLDGETSEQRDVRRAAGWEYSIDFPMRMVKTERGWRFDEFHCAVSDDGLYPFYNQEVPNPNAPAAPTPVPSAAPEPTPSASPEPSASTVCAHGLENISLEYVGSQLAARCIQCNFTYTIPGVTSGNWDGMTGLGDGAGWLREDLDGDGSMEVSVFTTDHQLVVVDAENGRLLTSSLDVWQLAENFNQNRTYEFLYDPSEPSGAPTAVVVSYMGETAQSAISEGQRAEMVNRSGGYEPVLWASDYWVTSSFLYGFPLHTDRGYDYDIIAHWSIAYTPGGGLQVSSFFL